MPIQNQDRPSSDDAIHSAILDKAKPSGPTQDNTENRFVGLGLTEEEATTLLKD